MEDRKFARIMALYVFCANYHTGQWSKLYRLMSRITLRYSPRLTDSAWEAIQDGTGRGADEWEDAREIYLELCRKHA